MVISKIVMALIIGSIYYGTPETTDGFFARGSVLFFSILFNALNAIVEINTLYAQRPIVEKHASYAFYHPFAEALGSLMSDLPIKLLSVTIFCIILYFLAKLRREASQFFIFLIFNLLAAVTMSCVARTIGAATKTISKALAIAGVVVLGVVIYTGK
jgi:ATP-binding cassette subfamily G (WHITE) protein 2 (PDR)